MNFDQIMAKIAELEIEQSDFPSENLYEDAERVKAACGDYKLVDEHGGGEGEGESCYRVYHFVDHDVYVRWDGWYASGDGSHYDESGYEVRPQERTITVFE